MKALEYAKNGTTSVLTTKCSGIFPENPPTLEFHFDIAHKHTLSSEVSG